MTATPETDIEQIAHLDFDPTCGWASCVDTADWIVWIVDNETGLEGPKVPLCTEHKEGGEKHFITCARHSRRYRLESEPLR